MKLKDYILGLLLPAIFTACSSSDEPTYPVFMQPASITTADTDGGNQTFEYDDYGRIIAWSLKYSDNESVAARYSYPRENTIEIEAEETFFDTRTYWAETIQLLSGRASKAEGTFIRKLDNDVIQIQKTYRLEFGYMPDNHLNVVKHSEIMGAGANITAADWEKSWQWENYLIWENDNLKEFQDFAGNTVVYKTTKYEYSSSAAEYPVIISGVINSLHHSPLFMQGVFGLNSNKLLKSASIFDADGNLNLTRSYSYELREDALIDRYTETTSSNTAFSRNISYKVNWTAKFN
ncbi:MAG: hypothetical protein NC418_06060 [Muribaculaceae bacterium]|nr:hypothetical protein [Muribaculaceae bacterium]